MASIKNIAKSVKDEAENGIVWIALWKNRKSWNYGLFWFDYDEATNEATTDMKDARESLRHILDTDPNAVILNGYYHNLGVIDGQVSINHLAEKLEWQYNLKNYCVSDFLEYTLKDNEAQEAETTNEATQDTNEENAAQEATQGADNEGENKMNKNKLLGINQKAFQALHAAKRFDFQKPYTIISGNGSFTHRSITKAIQAEIPGDYAAALLIKKDSKWHRESLRYVDITKSGFDPGRVQSFPYWEYTIDWFFTKGDFEDTRKKETEIYFVIAQSVDNLSTAPTAKPYDLTQRFRIIPDVTNTTFIKNNIRERHITKIELIDFSSNPKKFIYEPHRTFYPTQPKSDNILDYVDKSGYILWEKRRELFGKALKLRAEREKAAAAAADFSERENAIQERFNQIQSMLSSKILVATTETEFKSTEHAANALKWATYYLFSYRTKAKNNGFSSIKNRGNALDNVEKYLDKAMEEINNDEETNL